MKLLLDTHVVLWWLSGDARLDPRATEAIADRANEVLVSVASLWEIVVKVRVRKLVADVREIEASLAREGFGQLGISSSHLAALATLPMHHRDPFDHLLIAQSIVEDAVLVTGERMMANYLIRLL